ncbi:hypothetical protein FH972_025213 [Carpinus fangiana]|uniref:Hsp90 chaperone protein kinase-targeting subunit n=1 Tax=Carpinus fangiana TaxID=176857 RepID=A0A5N6L0L3_9ROSI|nr:hypothetical protein FH972_025213 [Carpinus fangiana]
MGEELGGKGRRASTSSRERRRASEDGEAEEHSGTRLCFNTTTCNTFPNASPAPHEIPPPPQQTLQACLSTTANGDDSDIEVHPNVDKKSFIRAKQNQIHQERDQRKHQIETLKYERIVNDGLLTRIDSLITALKGHQAAASSSNTDQLVFQSLIESAGDPANDQPPARPEGVHANVEDQPTFSRMMAALVDQVKKAVDEQRADDRMDAFIKEVGTHKDKVLDLQQQLLKTLADLEKTENSKITSESIKFGFNSSHVAKAASAQPSSQSSVELINSPTPRAPASVPDNVDSGAEADVEDEASSERQHQPSALGKTFGKLPPSDYRAYLNFITQNPAVLAERETDGLLMQAFDAQLAADEATARQCVHQALLLQYCRSLGRDGVGLFFKRITTPEHQARKVFYDDVNSTYARLRERAKALAKEEAEGGDGDDGEDREQIQLHAVNPGQKIAINIPDPADPGHAEARRAFEAFAPEMQKALASGELDEVNVVLGKMRLAEAEELVGILSESGMLSMEEGVIDATTDEGKRQVEEIERLGRMERQGEDGAGGPGPAEQAASSARVEELPDEIPVGKRAVDELD